MDFQFKQKRGELNFVENSMQVNFFLLSKASPCQFHSIWFPFSFYIYEFPFTYVISDLIRMKFMQICPSSHLLLSNSNAYAILCVCVWSCERNIFLPLQISHWILMKMFRFLKVTLRTIILKHTHTFSIWHQQWRRWCYQKSLKILIFCLKRFLL